MATGRPSSSGKLRLAAAVAALGLAMGVGGGVATASQQSPKAKPGKQAELATPMTCGAPTDYTSGSISILVRGCLSSFVDDMGMIQARSTADVKVSGPAIASCRVETEFRPGSGPGPSGIGGGVGISSCTDAVGAGTRSYAGGLNYGPGAYWNRVTVLVVTRTGTVRLAVATHAATLS